MKIRIMILGIALLSCSSLLNCYAQQSQPNISNGKDGVNLFSTDIALIGIIEPTDTFLFYGSQHIIKISIKNVRTNAVWGFNAGFSKNGSIPVLETYYDTLDPGICDTFTFNNYIFANPGGPLSLCTFISVQGDSNTSNDTLYGPYFAIPYYMPTYFENFDGNIIAWYATGSMNEWQLGIPSGNIINTAHSYTKAWCTKLSAYYCNNAYGELYSPLIDQSVFDVDSLKFWHWMDAEAFHDGGYLQYLNIQNNWITLGIPGDTNALNWYDTIINGQGMWTGQSNGWIQSAYDLSYINDFGMITQFRFVFISDSTNYNYDGWAIDDVLFSMPVLHSDAGVIDILSPVDTTVIGSQVQVKVAIQNFGLDTLFSISLRYVINNGIPRTGTWTGVLAPGDTCHYTFSIVYNSPISNFYKICSFTHLFNDMYTFNDSTCKIICTQVPEYDLGVIKIIEPDTFYPYGTIYPVIIRLKNIGLKTITNTPLAYEYNNLPVVVENWSGMLNPGDSMDYSFINDLSTIGVIGSYHFCAFSMLPGDGYPNNDTICDIQKNPVPIVNENKFDKFDLKQNMTIG